MNRFRIASLVALVLCLAVLAVALGHRAQTIAAATPPPASKEEVVHVLNRITFGPRPGDVAMVQQMGLENFIQQQLHPETLDDSALDQKLRAFDMLNLSLPQLMAYYNEKNKEIGEFQKAEGAAGAKDPNAHADPITLSKVYTAPQPLMDTMFPKMDPATKEKLAEGSRERAVSEMAQAKIIRAVYSKRQLQEVLVDFWSNHFNIYMYKDSCRALKVADERDVIRPHVLGSFRALLEASAKSPAMLVYLDNATSQKVQPIKPAPAPGKKGAPAATALAAAPGKPAPARISPGINENYGREIMELHTLGVTAGYTQKDVTEVARCFTGWTLNYKTGQFVFVPKLHDEGQKIVLGHVIPAKGGIKDGEMVLDILASHPATAHFISRELCQRFVCDNPPEALVQRTAAVFLNTKGDLRQVVASILESPEFRDPSSFQAKVKSPFEYVVSALRATDSNFLPHLERGPGTPPAPAAVAAAAPAPAAPSMMMASATPAPAPKAKSHGAQYNLDYYLAALGEPLFACLPPTGYGENSTKWVSPNAILQRLNLALSLTQHQLRDVSFNAHDLLNGIDVDQPDAVLNQCLSDLLPGGVSEPTRKVLVAAAIPPTGSSKTVNPTKLIALIIGSPEFQRK